MRPRDAEYARYLLLVETYRDAGWQPHAQWRASPFRVADVSVNAILIRAETDLAWLATKAGRPDLAAPIEARLVRARAAMAASWDGSASRFLSRDLIANLPIGAATSAGFLPLLTDVPTAAQVDAMATEIDRWRNGAGFGLATVPVADPAFDGRRYWRGPIWPMVNWMLADGLARHGAGSLAAALKGDIGRLLRHGGFAEYFDPRDGAPCGGGRFSWTAATGLAFAFTDD
jgi:glycogen debranching enzyme